MDLYTIKGTLEQGQLAVEALCSNYSYQEKTTDKDGEEIDNPESKVAFAKRQLVVFLKDNIKAYRMNQFNEGRDTIRTSAEEEVEGLTTN